MFSNKNSGQCLRIRLACSLEFPLYTSRREQKIFVSE